VIRHAIIVRMNYSERNAFNKALSLFKRNLLFCLEHQEEQSFDLMVGCNDRDREEVISASDKIVIDTFTFPLRIKKNGAVKPFEVEGFEDFHIQTRLDYDDMISPNFTKRVIEEYNAVQGNESLILSFQPIKLDLYSPEAKSMKPYHDKKCSMFLSWINPKKFIFCDSHLTMWKYADRVKHIDEGYAWLVVHEDNTLTRW
jgi:hypothetical protein